MINDEIKIAAEKKNLDRYSTNELLLCAEEELSISVKFYPGMVARGKMSAHLALDKIGKKKAICELLEELMEKNKTLALLSAPKGE
jgi:hypothetical protein